jgi:bifunctional UDP-N-acetylglucosamine pyrophosphorylase / glucosamine-1-phosphate N-acetyltransferase
MSGSPTIVILAAGEGTRMKSALPKVLHSIAGRSLVGHVLTASSPLGKTVVVIGAGAEQVRTHLQEIAPTADVVVQDRRGGTGHATRLALEAIKSDGPVVVVAGDTPLIQTQTLETLISLSGSNDAVVLTSIQSDPTGYGRIIRDQSGAVSAIVEEKDATDEQRGITEVNSGVYSFKLSALREALAELTTTNAQGEEYLTDAIAHIRHNGGSVAAVSAEDPAETLGINDRVQLAQCAAFIQTRINTRHMKAGVTILEPASTWIDAEVTIDADVTLLPGTRLIGRTHVGTGSVIGPRTTLVDTQVGHCAQVMESTCLSAGIGTGATVGPYAYLRPGAKLGEDAKVGAYVEVKNSVIGRGSKVPHLSYVGDAQIGEGSNIGAATVFVNYDGVEKHQTIVGDFVRIGSDTMLIAPVTIGDGAYTAAGSVITEDVPPGAIGVGRSKQRNVLEWVLRKRSGSSSADAAQRALESDSQPGTV